MKKSFKTLLAAALVAVTLGLAGQVAAMPYGGGPGGCMRGNQQMGPGGRGFNLERMSNRLNLTEEQRNQVQAIVDGNSEQMTDLRTRMQQNRETMRQLVQQTPFAEEKVRKLADEQGDLKADMIVLRAQQRSKINAILTDEQRAQMQNRPWRRR